MKVSSEGNATALSGKARVAGVIGWPVAHSLSPRLHGYWLRRYGIDGAYVPLPVAPPDLTEALLALPKLGFVGANVTVPHKQAVLPFLARISPEAARIGAVNTLVFASDGRIEGRNTDSYGFAESLREALPGWSGRRATALVLGAGGAARAIVDALQSLEFSEIRLVNRNRERAQALVAAFAQGARVLNWDEREASLDGVSLLVNTTSLGMRGQPPLPLSLSKLPADAVVADIVYTPLLTPLLRDAADRGHRIVDGLGMLLHQARAGFAAWFGVDPEVTADLRTFVVAGLPSQ